MAARVASTSNRSSLEEIRCCCFVLKIASTPSCSFGVIERQRSLDLMSVSSVRIIRDNDVVKYAKPTLMTADWPLIFRWKLRRSVRHSCILIRTQFPIIGNDDGYGKQQTYHLQRSIRTIVIFPSELSIEAHFLCFKIFENYILWPKSKPEIAAPTMADNPDQVS